MPISSQNTMDNNENVFNIQLNYDINQATDLESWDGEFKAVLLYGLMEHLAPNIKNIKESLHRMQKYILGKLINDDKANNVKDLESVRKAAWEFITALYESYWNDLLVDGTNRFFRNNVKSKFSLQIIKKNNSNKGKNLVNTSSTSSYSGKNSQRDKWNIQVFLKNSHNTTKKSYTQASANPTNVSNIARDILKIKEAFPKLQDKKIEIAQKIINGQDKPKPKLNMITKKSSCKQVIIPINNNSAIGFIKDLSTHVVNINRIFKNIKSSIMADFICIDSKGIIITTNNITLSH